jgi:LPXTG-motif cell wall-anchored protein
MSERPPNRASWAFLAGTLLGVLTIIVGASWSLLVSPAQVWSNEQALEYQAANDALHEARTKNQAGSADGEVTAEMAAAKARFDDIHQQLESARYAHDTWGHWIAAAGLGTTLLCGAGFFATRRRAE